MDKINKIRRPGRIKPSQDKPELSMEDCNLNIDSPNFCRLSLITGLIYLRTER